MARPEKDAEQRSRAILALSRSSQKIKRRHPPEADLQYKPGLSEFPRSLRGKTQPEQTLSI